MLLKYLIKTKYIINLIAIYNIKLFNKFTFKSRINKSIINAFKACLRGLASLIKAKNFAYI
jgi:hypothetical protein